MSAAKAIIKTFTIGLTIVSFVAVAETYYDKKFYTASFMDKVEEVRIDIEPSMEKRVVASKERDLPLIHTLEMKNRNVVNGEWMITRVSQFFEDKEEVVFDKFNKVQDKDAEVLVGFELIEKSTIRINNDYDQTYKISLLTENGTIALFKEFGEGYEVVEARRYVATKKKETVVESSVENEKKNKFDIRDDLYLVSAVDPKRDKNLLKGRKVEGYAYLKNGELILEGVQLHIGSQNQTESISTEMRVKAHGTFNDQNGSQGIVTLTSKQEIKVRFSTGPLAGALLNFATYDKKQEIEQKYEESQKQVEAAISNDDTEERREVGGGLDPINPQQDEYNNIEEDHIDDQYQTNAEDNFDESDMDRRGEEISQYPEDRDAQYQDEYSDEYQEEYADEYQEEELGYDENYQEEFEDEHINKVGFKF